MSSFQSKLGHLARKEFVLAYVFILFYFVILFLIEMHRAALNYVLSYCLNI